MQVPITLPIDDTVACTMEVRLCPDGSYVGRVAPSCEFAACPKEDSATEDDTVYCAAMVVKQCPDGSFVRPVAPLCEYEACPGEAASPVSCPADAKICPDGSTVGRVAPSCTFAACPTKETVETNDISFEVTTRNADGSTSLDWTTDDVTVQQGQQLGFRWDASSYGRCLLFLGDDGLYTLLSGRGAEALSGNTVAEGYDVPERTGVYRIECSEQANGEGATDTQEINVTAAVRATELPRNPFTGLFGSWGTTQ